MIDEFDELENQLFTLMLIIEPYIEDDFKDEIIEFITHCECGLAFEDILETIVYLKIHISEKDYDNFVIATKMMGMYESLLIKLKPFIRKK